MFHLSTNGWYNYFTDRQERRYVEPVTVGVIDKTGCMIIRFKGSLFHKQTYRLKPHWHATAASDR